MLEVDDLSPDQREVYDGMHDWVFGARREDLLTVGGYAGTGKSSLLGVFARALVEPGTMNFTVAYVSFTGRASSVLRTKLENCGVRVTNLLQADPNRKSFGGYSYSPGSEESFLPFCGTIHRLLYKPIIDQKTEEILGWTKRERLDRPYDLLVIDECFHYAQRVLTEDGWVSIGKIVNTKRRCRVWAYNRETGSLELKPIVRWLRHRAPKQLLRIDAGRTGSMRSARLLKCTPEHKILTANGYVRAGDLKVGDELVVRGRHFTPMQFSMLVGSMLGDGSMDRHPSRNSPQPKFTQGEDQLEWLKFKHAVYGDLAGKIVRGSSGYTDKDVWKFTLTITDQARRVAEQMPHRGFHPGGRRRWSPTDTFLSWIDELALAVWFLDDGSLHKGKYATLHSEGFDEETHERFSCVLRDRFGLDAVVSQAGAYLRLRFNKASTEKFFELIRPFVPACMAWKVPGSKDYAPEQVPAGEITVAPITAIGTIGTARSPWVYDLEVADHHNYIAGNVVVSNCSMVSDEMLSDLQMHDVPIIAVGDHAQLPPVMSSGALMKNPHLRLEKIHRQAEGNPIIRLSRQVREEGSLSSREILGEDAVRFRQKKELPEVLEDAFDALEQRVPRIDVGVLCWMNKSRVMLNGATRKALGFKGPPRQHEIVICLKNKPPVYNGMRGVVRADMTPGGLPWLLNARLTFPEENLPESSYILNAAQFMREKTFNSIEELEERGINVSSMGAAGMPFDFGYALTTHKSQGSQFKHAIVYLDRPSRPDDEDYRRWLYASVTRGSDTLTVLR